MVLAYSRKVPEFVENRGGAVPPLTVRTGVAEMLSFYESVSPLGCTNQNGDMLLFQWGTYDWGDGPQFEINITRQFMESAAEDDDAISQLQVTFKFPPDRDPAALGNGNRWCNSQSEIQQFREYIFSTRAFLAKVDWEIPQVSPCTTNTSSDSVLPESCRSCPTTTGREATAGECD